MWYIAARWIEREPLLPLPRSTGTERFNRITLRRTFGLHAAGVFGLTALGLLCTRPFTVPTLQDGQHTFEVRATDSANNQATASRTFTVDGAARSRAAGRRGPPRRWRA